MSLIARIPCRVKLFVVCLLLAASTGLAALAQILPLTKAEVVVFWTLALIGGSIAMAGLVLTAWTLLSTLDQLARRARAITDGDLTGDPIHICVNDEIGDLTRSVNLMQQKLQSIVASIQDESSSLHRDSSALSDAGTQTIARTGEQSAQTQQAASAMQQMSSSISEVSSHAHTAADQAREAVLVAREGGATVEEMLAGMNTISESVSQTAETVRRLGADSEQIIRIVNVIEEIAGKTNLLALNAAIEAARAGEQGRGFAVVAGEVRRLAESTGTATREIAQMIDTITGNTRAAVDAMSSGTERVSRGMEITARAGDSLKRIIAAAGQVESMIAQIAGASTEQSATAQEFSRSLSVINRLGEEAAAASPLTQSLVESVRDGASRLKESVCHFRIDRDPQRAGDSPCRPEQARAALHKPAITCGD